MITSKRRFFLCLEEPVAFGCAQRSIVQRGDDFVAVYNLSTFSRLKTRAQSITLSCSTLSNTKKEDECQTAQTSQYKQKPLCHPYPDCSL